MEVSAHRRNIRTPAVYERDGMRLEELSGEIYGLRTVLVQFTDPAIL